MNNNEKLREELITDVLLIEAIVSNTKLWKEIDKVYESKKEYYYKLAKDSVLYNVDFLSNGSLMKDSCRKKLIGIFCDNDQENMFSLVKKGWTKVTNYVAENAEPNCGYIWERFFKNQANWKNVMITTYIMQMYNRRIEEKELEAINVFMDKCIDEDIASLAPFYLKDVGVDFKRIIKNIRKSAFKDLNIENEYYEFSNRSNDVYFRKVKNVVSVMAKSENLGYDIFEDLNEYNVDEIIFGCIQGDMKFNLKDKEESMIHFMYASYIKALLKHYNLVKQNYQDRNEEEFNRVQEFINKNDVLEDKYNKLLEEIDSFKEEKKRIEKNVRREYFKEIDELKKQNRLLIMENNKLKEKMDSIEEDKPDISRIERELFNEDEKYLDLDILSEVNNGSRILIVGGNIRWQNRMKLVFPNARFIGIDNMNFDPKVINNIDAVYFNIIGNKHALFNKVKNLAIKNGIPFRFIKHGKGNLSINYIANDLKSILA